VAAGTHEGQDAIGEREDHPHVDPDTNLKDPALMDLPKPETGMKMWRTQSFGESEKDLEHATAAASIERAHVLQKPLR
jgi:hypothetical protein